MNIVVGCVFYSILRYRYIEWESWKTTTFLACWFGFSIIFIEDIVHIGIEPLKEIVDVSTLNEHLFIWEEEKKCCGVNGTC